MRSHVRFICASINMNSFHEGSRERGHNSKSFNKLEVECVYLMFHVFTWKRIIMVSLTLNWNSKFILNWTWTIMDKSESKLVAVVTHMPLTLIWLENFLINGFCFYLGKKKSFVLHSSNLNPYSLMIV